nr:hypothetical protein [Tanacetum cinerariifolium]
MHKLFPLLVKTSHCQKKFPLLVKKVPPAKEKRCSCCEVRTATEYQSLVRSFDQEKNKHPSSAEEENELTDKLSDSKNMSFHYKLALSQVEGRLVEFKNQEIKFCEKIRVLEFKVESKTDRIKYLTNELEMIKKEKDDTITNYSRPSPAIESNSDDLQNKNPFVTETGASSSTILSKPAINFVKAAERPTKSKTDKVETDKKPTVKYAKLYRKTSNRSNVRGYQRNWNNPKSQQLGKNFVMKKVCYNCGGVDYLSYDCDLWVKKRKSSPRNNYTHKSMPPRPATHKSYRPPI